jgi:hypothetical protein
MDVDENTDATDANAAPRPASGWRPRKAAAAADRVASAAMLVMPGHQDGGHAQAGMMTSLRISVYEADDSATLTPTIATMMTPGSHEAVDDART